MTKFNLAKTVSFIEQNAIIQNKDSYETMQKLGQINRRLEKNFETKDTINWFSAKKIRISSSKFRRYGLKRIANTKDISSASKIWKKEKTGHLNFSYNFSFKMKIDKLNQHFFRSCIESLPKFPSCYLCFWRNTQKVSQNIDVRNTWNNCVQEKKTEW